MHKIVFWQFITLLGVVVGWFVRRVYCEWRVKRDIKKIWKDPETREKIQAHINEHEKYLRTEPLFSDPSTDSDPKQ